MEVALADEGGGDGDAGLVGDGDGDFEGDGRGRRAKELEHAQLAALDADVDGGVGLAGDDE
jgi:hypothetical protein